MQPELRRIGDVEPISHRILPKNPPLSALTTPPLRLAVSVLFPGFAFFSVQLAQIPVLSGMKGGENSIHLPSSVGLDN